MNPVVSNGYTRVASDYDTLAGPLYRAGIRRLLPLLRVPPLPAILDVGSGTGLNLLEAAAWFGPARLLRGIDIAPGMVEFANRKAAMLGVPALFTMGDAARLPFPDQTFDLVICNSVLHWFEDRLQALREMRRVLRPGGALALICASPPGFQEWFDLMDLAMRSVLGPVAPPVRIGFVTELELHVLLRAAGLVVPYLRRHQNENLVRDPVSFLRLMNTVAPHWRVNLSPEVEHLVAERALALIKHLPLFSCTWSALEAVAVRP